MDDLNQENLKPNPTSSGKRSKVDDELRYPIMPNEEGKAVQEIKKIELTKYLLDSIEEKCTQPWKFKDLIGHTKKVLSIGLSGEGKYCERI